MNIQDNAKYFRYLFDLQESGETNMFGAGPYLHREFGIDETKAKEVLLYWMKNYDAISQELVNE